MSPRASSTRTLTESTESTSGDTRVAPGQGTGSSAPRPGRVAQPFLVQVAALRKAVGTTRGEVRSGVIDGLEAVGVAVPKGAPVTTELTLSSYPGGISVVGTVRAAWVGECRRCGGPVEGVVAPTVQERYAPVGGSNGDEEAYPLSGDELDLEPLARDAVLLDLPLAPLCSPECLGLCPQCGVNWNAGPCTCSPAVDPRWSALDSLRDP
jgi:uncharacterized protein